jgi:hypothetical protein
VTAFLRLLDVVPDQKGDALAHALEEWRSGSDPGGIFEVDPASFKQIPGAPFAYWVSERVRRLFTELPPFDSGERTVKQGLATADDFRFVRAWWEVDASDLGTKWFPFAKGGAYSPFYADVHLVVNWVRDGYELYCFNRIPFGGAGAPMRNTQYYFRPGLTWPLRGVTFSSQAVPRGCVFSVAGKMAFVEQDELATALGLFNSRPFDAIVRLFAGKVGGVQYEVGLIGAVRYPPNGSSLGPSAQRGWKRRRELDTASQLSHALTLPGLLQVSGSTLTARAMAQAARQWDGENEVARLKSEIDDMAFDLYGLKGEDRRQMEDGFASLGGAADEPTHASDDDETAEPEGADLLSLTEALVEWCLGVALGRFDVRLATGERAPPSDPEPFDPLPTCSPGMLQDGTGLPVSEAPHGYPIDLPPHALLVDDPGHPWDVVARIEAVLDIVAGEHAHSWIHEAESILGRDLRDWLRRRAFERHLKRYSRSRRKAPLFWHLGPKSRDYGVWLYSPVATRDTFYRLLNDYLEPRLRSAERRLLELRQVAGSSPSGQQRRDLSAKESLAEDLRAFRDEVARVAPLWAPLRDDGVVLNCAVLCRLFDHHRAWQKECRKKWTELADGKYDWAGWAMHLWPERTVLSCASDRSIAIAHGVEAELWEDDEEEGWIPRADANERIAALQATRASAAIKSALDNFTKAAP